LSLKKKPSAAMIVAVAALSFAMVGTAVAGPSALNKLTKSQVKKIAKKQADKELRANISGSHVNLADKADKADKATTADTATKATTADTATNATNATNAANSAQLEGKSLRGIQMWVHFFGSTIESQSGGITVTDLAAAGRQRVTFPTSVADCSMNANGGTTAPASDATNFSNFMVMLGRSTTGANDVQVESVTDAGTAADEPIWLTINC
jgi:hypothetical protein